MTHQLDRVDPTFSEDFRASHPVVDQVAAWVRSEGLRVEVPEPKERPDPSQRMRYSDRYDFLAHGLGRCEVKGRTLDFSSLETFPHPTVFVNPIHRPVLDWYFFVNRQRDGVLCLDGSTKDQWKIVKDRSRGRVRKLYEASKELLVYLPLT